MTQRLYPSIKPVKYDITLQPDVTAFTFSGEETVWFMLEKSSNTITLHAAEIQIQTTQVKVGKKELSGEVSYNEKEETITIKFPEELSTEEHELYLTFTGVLSEKMRGFYRSTYEVNGEERYMATTQFEEAEARRAFPCVDEPQAKAIFAITLIVPKHMVAISNTIPASETIKGDKKIVKFVPTPKMSTYILAFIVGELECIEDKTPEGVTVRVFAVPGKKEQTRFALDVAVKTLSFYQKYFDISYPLPVLDLIAIPDFDAGAMENWGAVTFREAALLIDPQNSSLANKQWVALVIAHELAHMWFGNLVTMEWWTHLWLNEGFAAYIEYLAVNELFPEWDLWNQFIATEHNGALQLDGLANTHPIEVPITDMDQLKEIFDEISYAKGASVIHMLATYLGKETFRDGLRVYLKKHAYGNAVTEDLWEAFTKVAKQDIAAIMKDWTEKPGYPVLTAIDIPQELTLSQTRFFASSISREKAHDKTIWHIPLTLATEGKEEKILLKQKEMTAAFPHASWVKVNRGEASFVRVLYTERMYQQFSKVIKNKMVPASDRMGILRDAFDGAEAGLLSTVHPLRLAENYRDDEDYTVWSTLVGHTNSLANILFQEPLVLADYKAYVKDLFAAIAQKNGWEKRAGEPHTNTLLRAIVLRAAAKYGDEMVIAKALTLFKDFLNGKALDPDIRSVVYNTAAENGGTDVFEALVKKYREEPLHQEKNRIGVALTVFQQPKILRETLTWSISKDVRPQETPRFILAMYGNPAGQETAWQFVKDNWEYFAEKYEGQHSFTRLVEGAGNMTKLSQAEDIQTFFRTHPTSTLARTIEQAVEQITANAAWFKRDREVLAAFLSNKLSIEKK